MKITIDDVSGLPEALKTLVADEDGAKTLDLSRVAPADEVDRFKAKAVKAEDEAIERRKALKAWQELGETPDAVRDAMKAQGGKVTQEQEQIIAKMKADHEAALSDVTGKLQSTYKRQVMSDLKAELAKNGVVPEGLDLLANYAASRIQFNDDGTPKVLSADGSGPMIGSGANGGATLVDLAKEMAGSIPHLVADKGAGGSGKQPGTSGGKPEGKQVRASDLETMTPQEKAQYFKANPGVEIID